MPRYILLDYPHVCFKKEKTRGSVQVTYASGRSKNGNANLARHEKALTPTSPGGRGQERKIREKGRMSTEVITAIRG